MFSLQFVRVFQISYVFLQSNKLSLLANLLLLCLHVDARGFTENSRRSVPLLG